MTQPPPTPPTPPVEPVPPPSETVERVIGALMLLFIGLFVVVHLLIIIQTLTFDRTPPGSTTVRTFTPDPGLAAFANFLGGVVAAFVAALLGATLTGQPRTMLRATSVLGDWLRRIGSFLWPGSSARMQRNVGLIAIAAYFLMAVLALAATVKPDAPALLANFGITAFGMIAGLMTARAGKIRL